MSAFAFKRFQRELANIAAEGVSPTVHVAPRNDDLTTLDALVIGPPDTPYECAMIHFELKMSDEYPYKPPHVKVLSTDGGALRVHPQLYAEGKVCLSILGTWHGPKWSVDISLRTLLLSIQSLLTEEPLRCEPGYENASLEDVDKANLFVMHEVARVLVLGQLEKGPTWGRGEDAAPLTAAMRAHLAERSPGLLLRLKELAAKHDGRPLRDPFTPGWSGRRTFDFGGIHTKLAAALHRAPLLPALLRPASLPQDGGSSSSADAPLSEHAAPAGAAATPAQAPPPAVPAAPTVELAPPPPPPPPPPFAAAGEVDDGGGALDGSGSAGGRGRGARRRKAERRAADGGPRGNGAVAPPSAAELAADDDGAEASHCRICHMTEEESDEALIVPCACSGSIRNAHSSCLIDWLRHSHASTSGASWRCDICRIPFRVRLGGRKRRGYRYLMRDVDVLMDPDFEAPGLVCILLVSVTQIVLSALQRCLTQILMQPAFFANRSLPESIGASLFGVLSVPAAILDIVGVLGYCSLVVAKWAILWQGPRWTPPVWGALGEDYFEPLLVNIADFITFNMGMRLDMFVFMCCWFWLTASLAVTGINNRFGFWLLNEVFRSLFGRPVPVFFGSQEEYSQPFLQQFSPAICAVLPDLVAQCLGRFFSSFMCLSLVPNTAALVFLFKRACWDTIPEPVEILPTKHVATVRRSGRSR